MQTKKSFLFFIPGLIKIHKTVNLGLGTMKLERDNQQMIFRNYPGITNHPNFVFFNANFE